MVSSQHIRSFGWRIALRIRHPDGELRIARGVSVVTESDYGSRITELYTLALTGLNHTATYHVSGPICYKRCCRVLACPYRTYEWCLPLGSVFTGERMMRAGSGLLRISPTGPVCSSFDSQHCLFLLWNPGCLLVEVADYSLINHHEGSVFLGWFCLAMWVLFCNVPGVPVWEANPSCKTQHKMITVCKSCKFFHLRS